MSKKKNSSVETRLIKALGHPLRQRILEELNRQESSPSRLAEALDEPLGNVSYHVKILEEYEAIELVGTRPVRGALEHTYRAIARPYLGDEHWARLPASVRRRLFDRTLQQLWEHVVEAAEGGGLDDVHTHISWTALELDRKGYEEISKLLEATLERIIELQGDATNRLAELDENERDAERTELAVMHYHRAAAPEKTAPARKRRRKRVKAAS